MRPLEAVIHTARIAATTESPCKEFGSDTRVSPPWGRRFVLGPVQARDARNYYNSGVTLHNGIIDVSDVISPAYVPRQLLPRYPVIGTKCHGHENPNVQYGNHEYRNKEKNLAKK